MLLCKIGINVTIVVRQITSGGIVRSHRKVRVVHVDSRIDEGHQIQSPKKKQGSREQGHVKSIHDPGIFVKALVNGVRANLLIDTGATVSLITRVMFDKDIQHSNPVVSEVKGDILSANKTPMKVKGKTKVDI